MPQMPCVSWTEGRCVVPGYELNCPVVRSAPGTAVLRPRGTGDPEMSTVAVGARRPDEDHHAAGEAPAGAEAGPFPETAEGRDLSPETRTTNLPDPSLDLGAVPDQMTGSKNSWMLKREAVETVAFIGHVFALESFLFLGDFCKQSNILVSTLYFCECN